MCWPGRVIPVTRRKLPSDTHGRQQDQAWKPKYSLGVPITTFLVNNPGLIHYIQSKGQVLACLGCLLVACRYCFWVVAALLNILLLPRVIWVVKHPGPAGVLRLWPGLGVASPFCRSESGKDPGLRRGFSVCEFNHSLIYICNPQINTCFMFSDMHRAVKHLSPDVDVLS